MPRRRRPLSLTGLAIPAVVALALIPIAGLAQTPPPDPSVDLLRPSPLPGNPQTPSRFRRPDDKAAPVDNQAPPVGKFVAPSRIGATPVYGSPSGFGAGDTGFSSTNTRKPKPLVQAQTPGALQPQTTFDPVPTLTPPVPPKPPAPKPKPPAEIHPLKAANRPGAALPLPPEPPPVSNPPPEVHPLPAANRSGASLAIPPAANFEPSASTPPPGTPPINTLPLGTPLRPLPLAEGDPYAALGLRAGSLLVYPALEMSAGYDTNPQHGPGGAGSPYFVVAPELLVRSDWARHSLTADIVGTYTDYSNDIFSPSLNRPYLNAKIDGRIDVLRDVQVLLENRFIVSTDNPGSPNLQAGLAKLPIYTTIGGTLGVAEEFNRLQVTAKGTFDRSTYANSVLTDGEIFSNDDRNFNQYAGILRLGYELNPGLKPFVEVSEDERIHDELFDRNGLQRDSTGTSAKVGGDLDLFGSLKGEIAVGYLDRIYKDPTLPDIGGMIADGSLLWQATALTTAKLTAASTVTESVVAGTSGAFSRDFNIQVDHAFLLYLIGTLQVGYGRDEYVGLDRQDNRYFASVGLTYKLNRDLQLKGTVRQDWLTSNATGVAYDATSFLLGLRLQR